jgi:hypothetical protein
MECFLRLGCVVEMAVSSGGAGCDTEEAVSLTGILQASKHHCCILQRPATRHSTNEVLSVGVASGGGGGGVPRFESRRQLTET